MRLATPGRNARKEGSGRAAGSCVAERFAGQQEARRGVANIARIRRDSAGGTKAGSARRSGAGGRGSAETPKKSAVNAVLYGGRCPRGRDIRCESTGSRCRPHVMRLGAIGGRPETHLSDGETSPPRIGSVTFPSVCTRALYTTVPATVGNGTGRREDVRDCAGFGRLPAGRRGRGRAGARVDSAPDGC